MRRVYTWFIVFVCVLFTGFIQAQTKDHQKIRIWENVDNKEVKRSVSEITVYLPDSGKSNGSSVIICPGGSYCYLGIKHEGYQIAEWLNKLGFTAFVLRYRVGIRGYHYPAMIQDLQRSIQIVRENVSTWHLNINSVGVMGFSAGGHLVGTSAIYYNENFMSTLGIEPSVSLRPDFTVMLYPVVSMHDSIAHQKSKRNLLGKRYHDKELENKMSLEDNVHEGMPPIFIMQAKKDNVVDYRNSLYFYQSLTKKHMSVHYLLYECGGHGFGADPKRNKEASQWIFDCEKWFSSIGINVIR
jgi:acetyl esterase/lipase